jgi:hypothetical protein
MDRLSGPIQLDATGCGAVALRLLGHGREGRVAAVFRSSFYIRSAGDFACVGHESLMMSALNVVTTAPRLVDWRASGVRVDTPWMVVAETIYVAGQFRIEFSGAEISRPGRLPADWRANDVGRALATLLRLSETRLPHEGLAPSVFPDRATGAGRPVLEAARIPISALRRWLRLSMRAPIGGAPEAPPVIQALVGLGPGLTPSGDDLLAGAMIALHAFGLGHLSDVLWRRIRSSAHATGNAISLAHLSAASEGQGCAAVHDLLQALHAGRCSAVARHLCSIEGAGHTSGWDALAGVVAVVEALLHRARDGRR